MDAPKPIATIPESPADEFSRLIQSQAQYFEAVQGDVDEARSDFPGGDVVFRELPATGLTDSIPCMDWVLDHAAELVLVTRWGQARCKLLETDASTYGVVRASQLYLKHLEEKFMETGIQLVILKRQLEACQKMV